MNKESYNFGLNIGQQLSQMGAGSLVLDDMLQGIRDAINNAAKQGQAAREEGEAYLKENAKKDGVKTTASGLQYMVIKEGNGKQPKATDKVSATTRVCSSTDSSSTAAFSAASQPFSASTR